jgi:hypothetical protein
MHFWGGTGGNAVSLTSPACSSKTEKTPNILGP